jgi:hypothetical protein
MKVAKTIIAAIALSIMWVGFGGNLGLGWKLGLTVVAIAGASIIAETLFGSKESGSPAVEDRPTGRINVPANEPVARKTSEAKTAPPHLPLSESSNANAQQQKRQRQKEASPDESPSASFDFGNPVVMAEMQRLATAMLAKGGAPIKNTKYTMGRRQASVGSFPSRFHGHNGIVPMRSLIDSSVGQEVALYWLDQTSFVTELAAVRPFQLFMKSGCCPGEFGSLPWLLFYVPNPDDTAPQPFAASDCYINVSSPDQLRLWRDLANQTHWHLTLLGANNVVHDFFEFENHFGLDQALDTMELMCGMMPTKDFMRAKKDFLDANTVEDMYEMA